MRLLRALASDAAPLLGLVLFQSAVGLSVAWIDRHDGAGPVNAAYAVFVQTAAAGAYLAARSVLRAREWKALSRARGDPLNSGLPPARGESSRLWKALALDQRREASRLLSAREAAAAADIEAFTASVHAMKAPVATLGLLADRSDRTGESLEARDVRLEAEELDRLLELALGRIRLADFEGDSALETVELRDLAARSLKKTRRLFIARGISVDLGEETATAESDRKWLGFILDQIVVNAAKYASASVRIRILREEDSVSVRISDDGPGIPAEDRDRIFTPSFTGAAGREADGSGLPSSGYGLHLALRAARKLGIRLELRDADGGGAEAVVSVPAPRSASE